MTESRIIFQIHIQNPAVDLNRSADLRAGTDLILLVPLERSVRKHVVQLFGSLLLDTALERIDLHFSSATVIFSKMLR